MTTRQRLSLIGFVLAAAALWGALQYFEPRSTWLRVEAPPHAVARQAFHLRIHLAPQAEAGVLAADLHWGTSRDGPMQYLSSGGPKAVPSEGGTFDYKILVPKRAGMRYVMGVIYWSKSGGWRSHRLAASTALIAVDTGPDSVAEPGFEPLQLQPPSDGSLAQHRPAALPRWLTGLLFFAAMIGAARAKESAGVVNAPRREVLFWRMLLLSLAVACLWECLDLEHWLGARARAVARAGDYYYPRAGFQKAFISLTVATTLLLLAAISRVRRCRRALVTSLALYAAITLVNLVSLHAIDRIAYLSWHGLTVVQTLKLLCAGLVCYGIALLSKSSVTRRAAG